MHLCQVDTFFAVGSPLGVFLALRNIRIGIGNNFSACLCTVLKKLFLVLMDLLAEVLL
jgi:hypothetical protein